MSTIQPELISILSIKVFEAIQTTADEYLDNPVNPDGVEIKIGQNTALNVEARNIRIRLNIHLEAKKGESESIGLSGEYGLEFQIHVENLDQFLVEKEGKILVESKLGGTLNGIVFSTARGIIFERTSSTLFKGVLLPVINPNHLLEHN